MTTPGNDADMMSGLHTDLIDGYLGWLRLEDRSPETLRTYTAVLRRAHAALPHGLPMACRDELAQWLANPAWSRPTRAVYQAVLRSFFRWCVAEGHLDYDPATRLPRASAPRGVPRPVTDEDLQVILTHAAPRVRLWAIVAAYAGARCIEISRLDRQHITEQTLRLHGKGNRERMVPTHPMVWAAVAPLPPGPIARTLHGRRASARYISNAGNDELRRLGLDCTMHQLRHWHATTAMAHGADLRTVQELLGHSSPATTAIYTAVSDRARMAAVASLPTVVPGGVGLAVGPGVPTG